MKPRKRPIEDLDIFTEHEGDKIFERLSVIFPQKILLQRIKKISILRSLERSKRMTDRETLENFLRCGLSTGKEVFEKFQALERAKTYESKGTIDCVYVPGRRKDRVLLVAHADTVFTIYPDDEKSHEFFIDEGDIYRSLEDYVGIGADDRAGCAILWLLKDTGHSLLITNNEEVGNEGAENIRRNHKELFVELNEHRYMIEFDRRNSHDYKVYDIPVTEDFKRYIEAKTGYEEADRRASTDIRVLCEKISGVNLSVGYYDEHHANESLNFAEWQNTLNVVRRMLEPEQPKFPVKARIKKSGVKTEAKRILRMDRLVQIFADTQLYCKTDPILKEAVEFGREHTWLYGADDYPELPEKPEKRGRTQTVNLKSFQAAMKYHEEMPDKKIAVLNFASSIRAGGGVYVGSRAQEESLCRCSTLYPLLAQDWLKESYYERNRRHFDFRNDDRCIYSQGVLICKTDDDYPERLSPEEFVRVDVITSAAPDMRKAGRCDVQELFDIHVQRAKHILHIAALNGVDILITGAFGCGAFKNSPELVAEAWKEALEDYRSKFEYVIFAVYFREHEANNFKAFKDRFNLNSALYS